MVANRLLPTGLFEFVDNGVLLTIVDTPTGQVVEKKVYEELTEALKTYRDMCRKVAKKLEELGKKSEKKDTDEEEI